jgi:hypothetical protein
MTQYFDVSTIVREVLRGNAFNNAGNLPPARLDTLAIQISQFLNHDQMINAYALGHTISQQGVGLKSISAVLVTVQSAYCQRQNPEAVMEVARRLTAVIEGFVEHKLMQLRIEQERFRQAEARARAVQPNIAS